MIGSIVSSAISPAPSILAATTRSLIPVSATTEQITKEVKLRGGGNQSEADEGDKNGDLHLENVLVCGEC